MYEDLIALQNGGVDSVMFSNEFSLPYLTKVDTITVAAMATAMLMLMISGLTLFLSRLLNSPADRSKRQVYIR